MKCWDCPLCNIRIHEVPLNVLGILSPLEHLSLRGFREPYIDKSRTPCPSSYPTAVSARCTSQPSPSTSIQPPSVCGLGHLVPTNLRGREGEGVCECVGQKSMRP